MTTTYYTHLFYVIYENYLLIPITPYLNPGAKQSSKKETRCGRKRAEREKRGGERGKDFFYVTKTYQTLFFYVTNTY
jgi:hypothetical protein